MGDIHGFSSPASSETAMSNTFPRTTVGGVSLSRMIIGTNWILGYSHTGAAADQMICDRHEDPRNTAKLLRAYLDNGIDTIMAPFGPDGRNAKLLDAVHMAEDQTGKRLILVDTPIINVDDNDTARHETEQIIRHSAEIGVTFCLLHHSSVEQLVNKNKGTMDRLPDYLKMVRDHGMHPGLSAHMPELVIYSDQNDYDVETYIQIYNCMGFLMQVEVEYVHKTIWNARRPVMTIKPMAAGRCSPFVGLTFSWATIRPCDMVTVGCLDAREALEDIEISRAAIERRQPDLEGRTSPNKKAAALNQ